MSAWSGRKVRRLVDAVLALKGTTCHLCDLPGADSADHNPPRSVLVASGVLDPDAIEYLFPAHRIPCNVGRRARPVTAALRVEMRAKRLKYEGRVGSSLSPRFARRRPGSLTGARAGGRTPSASISPASEKNGGA